MDLVNVLGKCHASEVGAPSLPLLCCAGRSPLPAPAGAWTGVRLVDLLRACKVRSYKQGARFVHTNGVKGELPQGDGTYGTSIHYGMAMDPASDVLVAYMYNGRPLAPDHGFPVRIIIPGCIGGRMVSVQSQGSLQ